MLSLCPALRERNRTVRNEIGQSLANRLMERNVPSLRQVALYGKEAIGNSTTSENTLAGVPEMDCMIPILGCDLKADSTRLILQAKGAGHDLEPRRERRQGRGHRNRRRDEVGYQEVRCVESRGAEQCIGCASRSVITSINCRKANRACDNIDRPPKCARQASSASALRCRSVRTGRKQSVPSPQAR